MGDWQRMAVSGRDAAMTHAQRPFICSRACAAPNGMRPGASEPPLAPYAGITGATRPVRGGGAGPATPHGARSPANITHTPSRRCKRRRRRRGSHLPASWYVANRRGAAPHAPREGTVPVCSRLAHGLASPRYVICHKSEGLRPSRSPRGNPDGSPRPLRRCGGWQLIRLGRMPPL
jgi:hypothetical protein